MTYLVGGGGGGITSVNGDAGPVVSLDASDVGAYPKITYADEATLLAASPTDGQFGYATAEDSNWRRENGKWVRWLGEVEKMLIRLDGGDVSTQAITDNTNEVIDNGFFIRKGGIMLNAGGAFSQYQVPMTGLAVNRVLLPESTATIAASAAPATLTMFGATWDVGQITFASGSMLNLYGSSEKVPLWSTLAGVTATSPATARTTALNSSTISMIYIATGANTGYHFIYDVLSATVAQVISAKQFTEFLKIATGILPPGPLTTYTYSSYSGSCTPVSMFTAISPSSNDGFKLTVETGPDQRKTDGGAAQIRNSGVLQNVTSILNEYSGTTSDSLLNITNSNASNNKPLIKLSNSGSAPDIAFTVRASTPTLAEGEIVYNGTTNRFVYNDGSNRSVAHTDDLIDAIDVYGITAIVAPSGGDYTTVAAAITASKTRILVRDTVTETTNATLSGDTQIWIAPGASWGINSRVFYAQDYEITITGLLDHNNLSDTLRPNISLTTGGFYDTGAGPGFIQGVSSISVHNIELASSGGRLLHTFTDFASTSIYKNCYFDNYITTHANLYDNCTFDGGFSLNTTNFDCRVNNCNVITTSGDTAIFAPNAGYNIIIDGLYMTHNNPGVGTRYDVNIDGAGSVRINNLVDLSAINTRIYTSAGGFTIENSILADIVDQYVYTNSINIIANNCKFMASSGHTFSTGGSIGNNRFTGCYFRQGLDSVTNIVGETDDPPEAASATATITLANMFLVPGTITITDDQVPAEVWTDAASLGNHWTDGGTLTPAGSGLVTGLSATVDYLNGIIVLTYNAPVTLGPTVSIDYDHQAPFPLAVTNSTYQNCDFENGVHITYDDNTLIGCYAGYRPNHSTGGSNTTIEVAAAVNDTILIGCRSDVAIVDGGTGSSLTGNKTY